MTNSNSNSNVMPLRILLNLDYKLTNSTDQIYNDKSELLFVFEEQPFSAYKRTVEFTDALFEELISISDINPARAFVQRHPDYTFSSSNPRTQHLCSIIGKQKVVTSEQLSHIIVNEMEYFHHVWDLYSALLASQKNKSNSDLVLAAFERFINHFDIFSFGPESHTLDFYSPYELSLLDDPEIKLTIPVEFSEAEATLSDTRTISLSFCNHYLNDALASETANVTIRQCYDDLALEFHCMTLLSAVYEKMIICEFNKDTYRKCDVCSNYFKVDKSHPQTRCDFHMRSRRKKRQSAKAKEKSAIEAETIALKNL